MPASFSPPLSGDVKRLSQLEELVTSRFPARERASHQHASLPVDNLRDLHDAGWLRSTLPPAYSGANSHLYSEDKATYLQAIRIVARVSPGTAHCLQVHNHAAWAIAELGTPEQRERFLRPMTEKLHLASFIGSEPGLQVGARAFQTIATKGPQGSLRISGRKYYATNGVEMGLGLVFTSLKDVEGGMAANHQMVVVTPDMPGVREEKGWYQPSGMRVAESPQVHLDDVHIPASHILGPAGAYPNGRWQGRFHLGFTATYLGAAEGILRWALAWIGQISQKKADPYVQWHVGQAQTDLYAAQSAFESALRAWQHGNVTNAELASMAAKSICARTAQSLADSLSKLVGSTALFDEHPLGRLTRDLQTHVLHVGHDRTYQTLGQAGMGQHFDSTRQR